MDQCGNVYGAIIHSDLRRKIGTKSENGFVFYNINLLESSSEIFVFL